MGVHRVRPDVLSRGGKADVDRLDSSNLYRHEVILYFTLPIRDRAAWQAFRTWRRSTAKSVTLARGSCMSEGWDADLGRLPLRVFGEGWHFLGTRGGK